MRAIFKVCPKSNDVIAFLPDVIANPGMIMSYMHVGQHGEASREFFYECKHASVEQATELLDELAQIYQEVIFVSKRLPNWWSWFQD